MKQNGEGVRLVTQAEMPLECDPEQVVCSSGWHVLLVLCEAQQGGAQTKGAL